MNTDLMFSSEDHTWETPISFFNMLNEEFNFALDVCAHANNAKCAKFFSPEEDGLKQNWHGICWMNPPYGRDTGVWMEKAYNEALNGTVVVCLVAARTDTKWWHKYAMKAKEIRFIEGRLRFRKGGQKLEAAPFPSAVVVFDFRDQSSHSQAFGAYPIIKSLKQI